MFLLSYVPLPYLAVLLSWALGRQQTTQLFQPESVPLFDFYIEIFTVQ